MPKHLFLEGNIQTGKSTLLRSILEPYMDIVGGFSSQRLTDDSGKTIAFRIVSAQDTRLTTPYEETPESIFRIIAGDKKGSMPKIFETEGLKYLVHTDGKNLMLLDEIGGIELCNDVFRNALYDLLGSGIPCIGVLKQMNKAETLSSPIGNVSRTSEYNLQLRQLLSDEFNGKIIPYIPGSADTKNEIEDFLKSHNLYKETIDEKYK